MKPPEKLYEFHVQNLRAITTALDEALASGRRAIARGDAVAVATHVRMFALLLGVWSECRLLKLLYEPGAFTDVDRRKTLAETALGRWHSLVECAFRRHFKIPQGNLQPPALPSTAHFRLRAVLAALDDDLGAVIALRNKLAHGQWVFPLNEAMDDVAQNQFNALRMENLLSLTQKRGLLDALCSAVHDLATSLPTFERDWDYHFRLVEQTRVNIQRKSYVLWAQQIRSRHAEGSRRRQRNGNLPTRP